MNGNVRVRDDAAKAGVHVRLIFNEPIGRNLIELVLSPGVPHELPEPHWTASAGQGLWRADHLRHRILPEKSLRDRRKTTEVIAITAHERRANLTTTALIGHVLHSLGKDAQIGGNIASRACLDLDRLHAGVATM